MRRILPASLRARLALLVLLAIVPAALLSVYTFLEQRRFAVTEAQGQALRLARLAAAEQDQHFTGTRDLLVVIARQVRGATLTPEACAAAMRGFMSPFFVNLGVATRRGDVVCTAAPRRDPGSIAGEPYFERAVRTRDFAVGALTLDRTSDRLGVPAAYPILANGRLQGVAYAILDPDWLAQIAARVELPAGARVTLVDAEGTIVARYPEPQGARGRALPGAVGEAVRRGGGERVLQAPGLDGAAQLFAVMPLAGVADAGRPSVTVEIPVAVALAPAHRGFLLNLLGLALVAVLACAGTWVGGHLLILEPVTRLVAVARRLSAGDLNSRTGLSERAGELGQLARAFDEMAASIEHHLTEQKRAEEALARSSRQNQLILTSAGEGIFGLDTASHVTFVNPAAAAMLGWDAAELLGRPLHDRVHHSRPDGSPYAHEDCAILSALRDGVVHHVGHEVFWRKDGSRFPVEYTSTPIREDGAIVGAVVVIRDVTERRQAEEARLAREAAEKASRAKSEFLSRMSHELRTPLNAVLGFGQLLEMGALDAEQRESVEQILRAGRHLLELINEVLDIARIEAGRLAMSPEPVSVREVVGECLSLIAPLAAAERVQLAGPERDDADYYVTADRQRLKQVLLNLLSNAVKYNRPGGSVEVAVGRPQDGRLPITVADTGPGIPAALLGRLFAPFERLGAEGTRVEGTGLGLALSKGLVEAMGGALSVKSVVGRGSTFRIDLAAAEPPRGGEVRLLPRPGLTAGARTILYIEDNLSNLRLIESLLAQRPRVRLLSAMQGRLGLDLAMEHRPHLILLDLHLPDIPGEEALLRLRSAPETRDVPVVVISADATTGQADRLRALGAHAYLPKPLDVRRLIELLNGALAKSADASPST